MTKTRNSPREETEQIQEPKDAVPGTGPRVGQLLWDDHRQPGL